ncbi:hypothetical protein SIAM614_00692 [Stappia aggregata IAM 12614]|uniref:Uncharacterized protein n=1 Tax=Roseibium aggregatum (strain ATCC 25650 / DSM 13394 / JCM 20685 / NBRC 16684 / NCIMB 2208 / IAM 12614 / B1) TaxID=384765 RepID=A0P2R1_ROSAI|nr:hypothetical protein SIAM614_00692 [Stappia aggregata IAM 12614] [Roseibium aggregatum IAM 12614]
MKKTVLQIYCEISFLIQILS